MVSLKTHNILDYVAGLLLLLTPSLFGFADIDAARNFFVIAGLGLITYSLFTRYEIALWRKIPLGVHMTLDVTAGVLTILAPYVFGYSELLTGTQVAVHWVEGLGVIGLVALTDRKSNAASIGADFRDVTDINHRKVG